MEHNHKNVPLIVLVGLLIIGNVYFGLGYFTAAKELRDIKAGEKQAELNDKVLDFTSMFVGEVLQADQEVDFETRLELENAVRGLEDEEIMAEWQEFVSSKTEREAQESVKRLLGLLVSKIQK